MIYVLFALSGAAVLVYQVVWQRLLVLVSGAGIYSASIVVAAFLGGLGLGQYLGGLWSRRLDAPGALRAFAGVECAIALFAAGTCPFYAPWVRAAAAGLSGWGQAGRDFAVLVLPTTLMGLSLPLLVRAVAGRVDRIAGRATAVYAANEAGAAVGALAAPWLLIRFWGLSGAVFVAASLNAITGLGALLWGRSALPADEVLAAEPAPPAAGGGSFWLVLAALSGFGALSLEMLALRVTEVALKASAFTFGSVLALYLAGIAVGSAVAARRAWPMRYPRRTFLACQAGSALYTGLALIALARMPMVGPLAWYPEYWARYMRFEPAGIADGGTFFRLYVAFPLVLFGPAAVFLGVAFRALQAAIHEDVRSSGWRVGRVLAANTAGCIAGTLLVGLLALEHLGTGGAARLVVATGGVFALIGTWERAVRIPFAVLAVLAAGVVVGLPTPQALWSRLHGSAEADTLVAEGAAGVAAVVRQGDGSHVLFTHGSGQSLFPYGGIHTLLGAVPVVVHPHPRRVAVVGLGSGDTAWAAGGRALTVQVDVLELVGAQGALLAQMATRDADAAALLADPRVRIHWNDGRQLLLRAETGYDVIEIDALEPTSVGSGNVNSVEFFQIVSERLTPGGLLCAWTPTPRARAALLAVFPHALELSGFDTTLVVASRTPLAVDQEGWRRRADEVSGRLGDARLRDLLASLETVRPLAATTPGLPANRDLFPADEFQTPYPSP